jgi:4-hydroxy-tetrahydrodipicolinate synthase
MNSKFKGLGVAMVTPFNAEKEIDYDAAERMVEHLVGGGVDYLVLLGTTGESVVLSDDEKKDFVEYVIKKNDERVPIVVGMGGHDTAKLLKSIKHFDFDGVDAILSVTPYYNKPTQKGLELHFRAVAAQSPVPVILYNVPGRTGINMTAETTLKLAHEVPNIIAIKEASANLNQQTYILRDRPEDFLVISGDDGLALPQICMGMDGVISVVGNVVPKEFSQLVLAALNGNIALAKKVHYKLIELIDALFIEGNPGGAKAALSILGVIENNLRLPLAPISESAYYKLQILLENK